MNRVSFTLPDEGLSEVKGFAYIEDDLLVLRITKSLLGLFDNDDKVIEIEPGALEEISLKKGLVSDKLILKPWSVELLDEVPGRHASQVELKIPRKQRDDCEALVASYDTLF